MVSHHGAKALADGGDGAAIGTVCADRGKAVQQRIPRDPEVVKPDLPVVYSIQASLGTIVLDPNAGHTLP